MADESRTIAADVLRRYADEMGHRFGLVVVILRDIEADGRRFATGEIAVGLTPETSRELIDAGDALSALHAADDLRELRARVFKRPQDVTAREWAVVANMVNDQGRAVWKTLLN